MTNVAGEKPSLYRRPSNLAEYYAIQGASALAAAIQHQPSVPIEPLDLNVLPPPNKPAPAEGEKKDKEVKVPPPPTTINNMTDCSHVDNTSKHEYAVGRSLLGSFVNLRFVN